MLIEKENLIKENGRVRQRGRREVNIKGKGGQLNKGERGNLVESFFN